MMHPTTKFVCKRLWGISEDIFQTKPGQTDTSPSPKSITVMGEGIQNSIKNQTLQRIFFFFLKETLYTQVTPFMICVFCTDVLLILWYPSRWLDAKFQELTEMFQHKFMYVHWIKMMAHIYVICRLTHPLTIMDTILSRQQSFVGFKLLHTTPSIYMQHSYTVWTQSDKF